MKISDDNIKRIIFNSLDFIHKQVEDDQCTTTEMWSLAEFLLERMNNMATIDEIASFFGQSNNNVRNVISRRMVPNGCKERTTRYKFGWFVRMMPSSWLKK